MKISPAEITKNLSDWFKESQGTSGPQAGSLYADTELTWSEAVKLAAAYEPPLTDQQRRYRAADPELYR